MASYFSRLSPVPSFPDYTGPYKVGTVDVEIPVAELDSPAPTPEGAEKLQTVQFRIFYPAQPDSKGQRITWLPSPQRHHISAYTKFLGLGSTLAEAVSFLPRHLHYTTIPAHKNADLFSPTSGESEPTSTRWPTAFFSHGLGGNRNTYSHIVGSLASYGVVVICPEHRDGSSIVSFVRDPATQAQKGLFKRNTSELVPYVHISHSQTPETWAARDRQLRIRLWELGLVYEAVAGLDLGDKLTNLNASTPAPALRQFGGRLDVHEPGRVVFAGHSFGASTVTQFVKSTFYAGRTELASMAWPLFVPREGSRVGRQVTDRNPLVLLDMWCFPLLSPATAALHRLPLPAYARGGPGGGAVLAVESDAFVRWREHLHAKARILSPDPGAPTVSGAAPDGRGAWTSPHFFYVHGSAHLSQSDFGILFPWLTRRIFAAEAPERALRLNLRAALQLLRRNGVCVAPTAAADLVDGGPHVGAGAETAGTVEDEKTRQSGEDDAAIFDRSNRGAVDVWSWIDVVGMGDYEGEKEGKGKEKEKAGRGAGSGGVEGEEEMEAEMEPGAKRGQGPVERAKTVVGPAS